MQVRRDRTYAVLGGLDPMNRVTTSSRESHSFDT